MSFSGGRWNWKSWIGPSLLLRTCVADHLTSLSGSLTVSSRGQHEHLLSLTLMVMFLYLSDKESSLTHSLCCSALFFRLFTLLYTHSLTTSVSAIIVYQRPHSSCNGLSQIAPVLISLLYFRSLFLKRKIEPFPCLLIPLSALWDLWGICSSVHNWNPPLHSFTSLYNAPLRYI